MNNKRIIVLRVCLIAIIVAWCTFIFIMSGETADISSDRSEGLSEKIINAFLNMFGVESEDRTFIIESFEVILRKCAHMFAYFVLASLSLCFFFTFKKLSALYGSLLSSAFTLVYALSDEIHQLYVEGRSGSLFDVMIDMIGALIGIAFVLIVAFWVSKAKKKKHLS